MIKSESIAKLAVALLKAQRKMGVALKDSKNPFFKSKYADLNAVIDASVPVLNDEGIAVLQNVNTDANGSSVQTVLLHESGEYIESNTPITVAKQNDPQALGSAISYARRYGLQAMSVLKAEDDDGNAGSGKMPSYASPLLSNIPKAYPTEVVSKSTDAQLIAESTLPKKKVSFSKKSIPSSDEI